MPLLGNILDTQQMFSFVNRFLEIVSGRDLHNTRGERRGFHALLRTESIQVLAVFKSHVYEFLPRECFAYPVAADVAIVLVINYSLVGVGGI